MKEKSPETQLAEFIAKYTPAIAAVAAEALEKMRAWLPGAIELVYDNYNALAIGFGPTERASEILLSIALYPRWVSVFFMGGVHFPDPEKLLKGAGKGVRHIVFKDATTLDKPAVQALIRWGIETRSEADRSNDSQPNCHQVHIDQAAAAPSPIMGSNGPAVILAIKLVHMLIFFFLSACILYILYCGITNRYSHKAAAAFALVVVEGAVLALNGWKCPLTTLAQNLGAAQGDVASLFLPRWLADHIFGVCTPLFIASSVLLLIRRLWAKL